MKKIVACFMVLCIAASLVGCSRQSAQDKGVLHLGLDAEILEINSDSRQLYIKGLDTNNDYFGERCLIDCSKAVESAKVFYSDNSNPENNLIDISLQELQVGDTIIIAAYENELNCPENGAITVEQIQLNRNPR